MNLEERRRQRNKELIKSLKDGTYVHEFNNEESWFPKRKKIEKDPEAIKRLYRDKSSK